jgi:hypothetical protein
MFSSAGSRARRRDRHDLVADGAGTADGHRSLASCGARIARTPAAFLPRRVLLGGVRVTLLAVLAVVLVLGACGGTSPPARASSPTPPAPAPAARPGLDSLMAIVLLAEDASPDVAAVIAAYREVAPGGAALAADDQGDAGAQMFTLGDRTVAIARMSAPVPGGEAEAHARYSLGAIATGWQPPPHVAHAIVFLLGDRGAALDSLRDFTRFVAAVTRASGAVGVYVGNGGATHPAAFFVDAVKGTDDPIYVWSGISIANDGAERISLLSLGMKQLGLPDLLLTAPAARPSHETIGYFYDLLLYVARRGQAVPDGDTVGREGGEALPVRYVPSPIAGDVRVMRVDLP